MREINGDDIKAFCDNFAYEFVTTQSLEESFSRLTGEDMLQVYKDMKNSLHLKLGKFIKKHMTDESEM